MHTHNQNLSKMKSLFASIALFASLASSAQPPGYVPSNGLLVWYPFNNNALDESGNGHNGVSNNATMTNDRNGNANAAYHFNGSSAYIDVPYSNAFNLSGSFSISSWFRLDGVPSNLIGMILSNHDGSIGNTGGWTYGVWTDSNNGSVNKIAFQSNPDFTEASYPDANGVVNNNQWYHYVAVYDQAANQLQYYLDGNLVSTINVAYAPIPNTLNLRIGNQYTTSGQFPSWFYGDIDDIGIWNRALNWDEVAALFQALPSSDTCVFTVYDTIVTNVAVYDTVTVYDTITTYSSTTDTLLIDVPTGLSAPNDNNVVSVYPNPAHTHVLINNGNYALLGGYSLTIENSLGQVVFDSPINQQLFDLDLSSWGGNGTYFLSVIDGGGNTLEVRKIILQ